MKWWRNYCIEKEGIKKCLIQIYVDDHIRVLFPKTLCFEFYNQFGNHTTMWIITSKHGNKVNVFMNTIEFSLWVFCSSSVCFSLMHDSKAGRVKTMR